jgi:hypothetical protein
MIPGREAYRSSYFSSSTIPESTSFRELQESEPGWIAARLQRSIRFDRIGLLLERKHQNTRIARLQASMLMLRHHSVKKLCSNGFTFAGKPRYFATLLAGEERVNAFTKLSSSGGPFTWEDVSSLFVAYTSTESRSADNIFVSISRRLRVEMQLRKPTNSRTLTKLGHL